MKLGAMSVSSGFLFLLALLNVGDTQGLLFPALFYCMLHELGHYVAITILGGRVTALHLSATGAEMTVVGTPSYPGEILCALAGPGVNLVLAFWLAQYPSLLWMAGLNLSLGLFNLLPVLPLDGGRVVSNLLTWWFGCIWGGLLYIVLSSLALMALLICGGLVLLFGGNFTLLWLALWLYYGQWRASISFC